MNPVRHISALLLALPMLHASIIDVTSTKTVLVSRGDTLSFELFTESYYIAAEKFGLPAQPDMLQFALITAPLSSAPQLSVTLRSADSSFFVPLGAPLGFSAGSYSSNAFQGNVSALQGQFVFNPRILPPGPVWLDFTNHGAGFTLGLEPLNLSGDLYVSLSGGPLTVGAFNGAVLLDHPLRSGPGRLALVVQPNELTLTPEPAPVWMLCGGGLFLALSGALRRLSRI